MSPCVSLSGVLLKNSTNDLDVSFQLEVKDVSALGEDAQGAEDEISDPEEDSLAGQMAAMRGGSVKKRQMESDDDDDDSDTDGDKKGDDSSDSDSD